MNPSARQVPRPLSLQSYACPFFCSCLNGYVKIQAAKHYRKICFPVFVFHMKDPVVATVRKLCIAVLIGSFFLVISIVFIGTILPKVYSFFTQFISEKKRQRSVSPWSCPLIAPPWISTCNKSKYLFFLGL